MARPRTRSRPRPQLLPPRGAQAAIGASCCGDEDIDDWAIAQVEHHEIEVPIKYRYYNGYLQAKHGKIAVMYCEDETDWRNGIKLEEAEFVDGVRFTRLRQRQRRRWHRWRHGDTRQGETGGTRRRDASCAQERRLGRRVRLDRVPP
jgi:hypothetical protein